MSTIGPETDSATCCDCFWTASGPHSQSAAAAHVRETGHRTFHYATPPFTPRSGAVSDTEANR